MCPKMFKRMCNWKTLNRLYHQRLQQRYFESIASTIFALSTNIKSTGSAIGVIRVSGQNTLQVIDKITNGNSKVFVKNPRKAIVQRYYDPTTLEIVDYGLLLWFPKPKSYTGENMCELQVHGSHAVITKLLAILSRIDGCRPATKGEFTKRALSNGKLQLIQAEGIRDLVHAQTETQRRRALTVMSGSLDIKFTSWRRTIIQLIAHLEAYIDFSEDELISSEVIINLNRDILSLINEIDIYLKNSKQKSDLIKDGFRVAIIGEANVGKSSIINKLCEKDVSIISPISGTTRDVVETWLNTNGNSVCVADTAGIKDLNKDFVDEIERIGIKKAIERAKNSNLIIFVVDSTKFLNQKELKIPTYLDDIISSRCGDMITVINKIDLLNTENLNEIKKHFESIGLENFNFVSCLNGEGLSTFYDTLCKTIEDCCHDCENIFSNERHVAHLRKTLSNLRKVDVESDLAIAALHLQQASYHLGCLTGNITTEDVLDVIFKDFCIGK